MYLIWLAPVSVLDEVRMLSYFALIEAAYRAQLAALLQSVILFL
jgi:hypothetical protein